MPGLLLPTAQTERAFESSAGQCESRSPPRRRRPVVPCRHGSLPRDLSNGTTSATSGRNGPCARNGRRTNQVDREYLDLNLQGAPATRISVWWAKLNEAHSCFHLRAARRRLHGGAKKRRADRF